MLAITRRAGVPLIINDRVDVAMAIGAGVINMNEHHFIPLHFIHLNSFYLIILSFSHYTTLDGVHVGQSDMSCAEVRRLLGPDMILGVSTKSCAEVRVRE